MRLLVRLRRSSHKSRGSTFTSFPSRCVVFLFGSCLFAVLIARPRVCCPQRDMEHSRATTGCDSPKGVQKSRRCLVWRIPCALHNRVADKNGQARRVLPKQVRRLHLRCRYLCGAQPMRAETQLSGINASMLGGRGALGVELRGRPERVWDCALPGCFHWNDR